MLVLRYAALVAIAAWIGGLVALGGIAAPAAFDVAAVRGVADGRALAGAIAGEAFRRFHVVSYACGAILLLTLALRAVLGPRPRRFSIRLAIAALMLASTAYSGIVLSGSMARVQREIGTTGSVSSLPDGDPRRIEFNRLHRRSTMFQIIPLVGGLILMFFELKD
jgi:hypothetical protein